MFNFHKVVCALVVLGITHPAAAAPQRRQLIDSWPRLALASDGDCQLEILGNGKFMLIRASGLGPAERGRFSVTNPEMWPVDWRIISDTKGVFVRAFMPKLWQPRWDGTVRYHQSSGIVTATVATRRCAVTASAPWRSEVRVIP
jgi:hypothetical protein